MHGLIRTSAAALALLCALDVAAQDVTDSSYVGPDGTRVLRQSIEVPASSLEVWNAFTTTEGVRSWAVPVAAVDFRLGGIWESSYRPDARIGDPTNIKNRFISFLPLRMLSMQVVQAPPDFPHRELLAELFTVIESEELAPERTRVTVSMVGYRAADGYEVIYRHFEQGNAWTLEQLRARFVNGPVDWRRMFDRDAIPAAAAPGGN